MGQRSTQNALLLWVMNRITFLGLALLTLFAACNKGGRYDVPPEVDVYVQRFIEEGNKRGHDIKIKRLKVTYNEDLELEEGNVIGRCAQGFESPRKPIIELHPDFELLSPEAQEQLVFHELGHCILDRHHDDRIMANGHFESTMNSHFWNYIAGQDYKREHYLDELFSDEVNAPSWVNFGFAYSDVDPATKTVVFEDEFNDNSNGWNAPAGHFLAVHNGNLELGANSNTGASVLANVNVPNASNYEIEAIIKLRRDHNFPAGLVWNAAEEFNLYGFNLDGETSIGDLQFDNNLVTATPCGLSETGFNKLTVRYQDGTLYFFLNERQVDQAETTNFNLNSIGLLVGSASNIHVDALRVYTF